MKSIKFEKTGLAKDVLFFVESEVPEILKGEVLVKMMARPLNPSDYMFIRSFHFTVCSHFGAFRYYHSNG